MLSTRYRITHRTHYSYSEPVAICQNQLRMQPNSRDRLTCHQTAIAITPPTNGVHEHQDYFGNRVYSFVIESQHRALDVVVASEVTVQSSSLMDEVGPNWEQIESSLHHPNSTVSSRIMEFEYDSPRVRQGQLFAKYARKSFTAGRGILEATLELTRRINAEFRYDTTATDVDTSTDEAFELRAGVCQDFAHVQIACLRSIGLPARYVSGYLRTIPPQGKPRLVGADESHAWLSVYAGELLGWVDFDPTNACFVGTDHIPICIGRDYGDVSPMRGVVLGGGQTTLKVSVDVETR